MQIINKPVYVSLDGREFTSEKECLEWEKAYTLVYQNIQLFEVFDQPELTEGRGFQRKTHVAVYCHKPACTHEQLLRAWLFDEMGSPVLNWYCDSPTAAYDLRLKNKSKELSIDYLLATNDPVLYITWSKTDHKMVTTSFEAILAEVQAQ